MEIPQVDDYRYEDYYTFIEEHGEGDVGDGNQAIWDYIFESQGWGNINEELAQVGWYNPLNWGQ